MPTYLLHLLTHDNDHTGARLAIAKYLNDDDYIDGYTNILNARDKVGNLGPKEMRGRDELDTKLFRSLKDTLSPSDVRKIMSAL